MFIFSRETTFWLELFLLELNIDKNSEIIMASITLAENCLLRHVVFVPQFHKAIGYLEMVT